MSSIKLEAPFTAFRGKICKHSKIIFAQRGDTQYTSQKTQEEYTGVKK